MPFQRPQKDDVIELATVLDCVAGRDDYDPRQAAVTEHLPTYRDSLGKGVEGLAIGLLEEGFGVRNGEPVVDDAVPAPPPGPESVQAIRAPPSLPRGDTRPRVPHRAAPPRDSGPRSVIPPTGSARAGGSPGAD